MNRLRLGLLRRAEGRVIKGAHARAAAAIRGDRPVQGAGPRPALVGGGSLFNRSDASPEATFTPAPSRPLVRETRPLAGLATAEAVEASRARAVHPFVSAGAPKTLLFDKLAAEMPLPAVMSAGEKRAVLLAPAQAGTPGSDVMVCSSDGWAGALAAARLRTGEWDDPQAGLDQIATRTAAGFTTARGHLRETLAGGWRSVRELAGQDLASTGPQHVTGDAA